MTENMGSDFIEKGTQMASKCMERCSTSLLIRKIQMKNIMRCHCAPTRLAKYL